MSLENLSKVQKVFKEAGPISGEIDTGFAESTAKRWESAYTSYINSVNENPGNADSMKEGKLWMDYRNKVRPNLVLAKLSTEKYDGLAEGLIEKDKKSYGSCPSC